MKAPNIPDNVDFQALVKSHTRIARLASKNEDTQELANAIIRFSLGVDAKRVGIMARYRSSVLLNALEPVDGFNPYHLDNEDGNAGMSLGYAAILEPKTSKADKREISLSLLTHPDAKERNRAEILVKTQFPDKEFKVIVAQASEKLNQKRILGLTDSLALDAIAGNGKA